MAEHEGGRPPGAALAVIASIGTGTAEARIGIERHVYLLADTAWHLKSRMYYRGPPLPGLRRVPELPRFA
jgi:hypothetical protein